MNNIVPADEDCLSQDQLSRYVQDECRLEEMRWIDRHLLHCPMCSDAVEGAMLSDMTDFQSVMSRVEAKIDTKVNTDWATQVETAPLSIVSPKRFWIGQRPLKWVAAAGLMGVMTMGIWQYSAQNVSKSATKMATVAEAPAPAAPATAEMAAAPAATSAIPQTDAVPNPSKNVPSSKIVTPNVYADAPTTLNKPMPKPTPNSDVVSADKVQDSDMADASPNKNKKEAPIADNHSKQPASDPINDVKLSETRAEAKAETERTKDATVARIPAPPPAAPVASAPSAPSVYESNGSYGGAANQAQGAAAPSKKTKSRSSAADLYENAFNAYKQKNYTTAIAGFNQVLAQQPVDKNDTYENTLWYLADAYLQTGDRVKAKALLERIVAEKLQYQRKASQKLKDLN